MLRLVPGRYFLQVGEETTEISPAACGRSHAASNWETNLNRGSVVYIRRYL